MNNNQFFHQNYSFFVSPDKYTVALEVIEKEWFECLLPNHTIILKVGIAICSKKDQYNRKIGKQLSESRMMYKEFRCTDVLIKENGRTINLVNNEGHICQIYIKAGNRRAFFIYYRL